MKKKTHDTDHFVSDENDDEDDNAWLYCQN